MCITEYDEEKFANEQREEDRAEGVLITLIGLVKKGFLLFPGQPVKPI